MPATKRNNVDVHPDLQPKTVSLLRKMQRAILAKPQKFDMHQWGITWDKKAFKKMRKLVDGTPSVESDNMLLDNACGTAACLAGHCLLITSTPLERKELLVPDFKGGTTSIGADENGESVEIGYYMFPAGTADRATEALGLKPEDADKLFYFKTWGMTHGWPSQFSIAYDDAQTHEERAEIASQRIDHFIKYKE